MPSPDDLSFSSRQPPRSISNSLFADSISHVSEWADTRQSHRASSTVGEQLQPKSTDDLFAIYQCFDMLERVWPTEPDSRQTAGPFTLEKEIGRGGMGRVWSAIQHKPVKRNVAVKLINPGSQTQQMVKRFESERNVLALMNHPAIATLIDAGQTDDGQLYFAMELVDGPDLTHYCNRNRLNVEQRLTLFLDACAAVEHAHQKGIIHRDLKPSNILVGQVDDQARLKVIDFGLSKSNSATLDIANRSTPEPSQAQQIDSTRDGQVIGSLRYMSPEQAAADLASVDVRSDVYSLGIVLFKLLTDSAPLDFRGLADVPVQRLLDSIQFEEDSPPSQCLAGLPKVDFENIVANRKTSADAYHRVLKSDLDWITMQAIEKKPESRYQTVAEFASDIKRFLNNEPVLARPESLLYNARKELSKNRVLWTSVAGVILALISGILISGYGLASANSARNLAEKRLEQSRKSNEILSDIFSDLNLPSIEMETEPFKIVVGRKLVQAAKGLNSDSIGDPLEVVELKVKLADALNGLEFFDEAVPVSREAWDIVRTLDQDQNLDLKFRAGITLVKALSGDAKTTEASDILTPLFEECLTKQGENGETCLDLLLLKGQIAYSTYDDDQARHCFTEVATRREALWGKSDLRTLEAKYWVTEVYLEPGLPDAGQPMAEEVTQQYRRLLPKGHPRTIKAILNYASMLSFSSDFPEAFELANEGLELAKSTYGENHPTTSDAKLTLGLLNHRSGNHNEGVRLLEEAWAGLSETTGIRHPRAITARIVLAHMSNRAGNHKRAISLMEEALSLSHPRRAIEIRLADFHIEVGQYDRARSLLNTAIANSKDSVRAAEIAASCMTGIGQSFAAEGMHPEAIEAFNQALELTPATELQYDFPVMRIVLRLTRSHYKNGNYDQATKIINEYLESMPASMGPKNRVRLCCHAEIGLILRRTGKTDEAITQLMSVFESGVHLVHQDELNHELRIAQAENGETETVLAGVDRQLSYLRSSFRGSPLQQVTRLRQIGYDLIELQLPERANEVLVESVAILEEVSPESWMLAMTRFDIAQLDLEHQTPETESGLMVSVELEEAWNQLAEMKNDAFPIETRALAESVEAVIRVYASESDSESVAIWQDRLKTLKF